MVQLNFIESLKTALDRLDVVTSDIDKLNLEKDELRAKIRKWLDMHGLKEFESYNTDKSKLWQMVIAARKRSNVDKKLLAETVTQDKYNEIVTESEYEVFTVKKIKQSKHAKSGGGTAAPKGTI